MSRSTPESPKLDWQKKERSFAPLTWTSDVIAIGILVSLFAMFIYAIV